MALAGKPELNVGFPQLTTGGTPLRVGEVEEVTVKVRVGVGERVEVTEAVAVVVCVATAITQQLEAVQVLLGQVAEVFTTFPRAEQVLTEKLAQVDVVVVVETVHWALMAQSTAVELVCQHVVVFSGLVAVVVV